MGIFDRLSRVVRSNINDLIARAENPEKMLVQIIEDMRRQLAQAKQEVAVAIADERRLHAQFEDERGKAADWERRARLAIREGRDDLAKQALVRGQEHADQARDLEEQWLRHRDETERLKDSLRQLNAKIEEAKRKKNLLVAKQKRAQAQQRIHETMVGLQDRSAFRAFDQMAEKIETDERRALAAAEVTEELEGDQLVREFAVLESGELDVDDRLLALKRQMGLLPEGRDTRALEAGEPEAASGGETPGAAASGSEATVADEQEPAGTPEEAVAEDEEAASEPEAAGEPAGRRDGGGRGA